MVEAFKGKTGEPQSAILTAISKSFFFFWADTLQNSRDELLSTRNSKSKVQFTFIPAKAFSWFYGGKKINESYYPGGIYFIKVNNGNTKTMSHKSAQN